jgi:lipoate-protein ligase B
MLELRWTFLGRVPYQRALDIQYAYAEKVALGKPPMIFLLEHPPTVTLGRQADPSNLRLDEEGYRRKGIEVFHVLRGGDVTFHGPGQLVGYPVASLDAVGCSVPMWVEGVGRALLKFLLQHGVQGAWSDVHPGIWVGKEKIAAVGFHLRNRISTHGFALNLNPDLACFETIVPCGIRHRGVTSMEKLGVAVPPLKQAAFEMASLVTDEFGFKPGPFVPATDVLEERLHEQSVPMQS